MDCNIYCEKRIYRAMCCESTIRLAYVPISKYLPIDSPIYSCCYKYEIQVVDELVVHQGGSGIFLWKQANHTTSSPHLAASWSSCPHPPKS